MSAVRVPVLMYHRVGKVHNDWDRKYCVGAQRFADQMHALDRAGWQAVSIDEFFAWMDGRAELPEQSFLLTFDDGFLSVYEHAAPVLAALGWPATVFLVTALIGQCDEWCQRGNSLANTYPLLGRAEIEAMGGQGFSFHSHSRTHADLSKLPEHLLRAELADSRAELEDLLGRAVPYVAYPYGRFNDIVLQIAEEVGYKAGFSVEAGFNRPGQQRMKIRRLDVFGTDTPVNLLRKVKFGTNDGSWRNIMGYYGKNLFTRVSH